MNFPCATPCRVTTRRRASMIAIVAVSIAGCGEAGNLGQVSGRVTYQDAPVTAGTVVFENRSLGVSVRASLDAEGRFSVRTHDRDGLPAGVYQVAVTSTQIGSGESPFVGGAEETAPRPTGPSIPEKYQRVTTSGLKFEVKPGPNSADLNLR